VNVFAILDRLLGGWYGFAGGNQRADKCVIWRGG
jgi:hypothetical protein